MASHHGTMGFVGQSHFCNYTQDQTQREGRFGRMFPSLPALYTDPDILASLGALSGPMDGGTAADRTLSVPVGQVFFGQFVDHDITLDTSSSLSAVNVPQDTPNVRTPTLDLDCVYGDGPEGSPFMYVQEDSNPFKGVKLLTGADGTAIVTGAPLRNEDLSRSSDGTAIIGDPRNDENRIISQIQLGMIRFHNNVADHLAGDYAGHELFEETRKLVTRHYHWAVINDFLIDMCGEPVVCDILANGRKFYCAANNEPFIPIEFSVAAYRFGHSMVPQEINIIAGAPSRALFGTILGGGFTPLPSVQGVVDFNEIFDTGSGANVQKAEKLDTKLASILLNLPFITSGESSLATRNLLRGQSFLLPSGEAVAALMGRDQTEITLVSNAANDDSNDRLKGKTPLWYYLLKEAELVGRETEGGQFNLAEGLGPVGARIVAEVIIGLMELDPRSFLSSDRSWSPAKGLGAQVKGVGDMLVYVP